MTTITESGAGARAAKVPYETPKLIVHGSVERLTEGTKIFGIDQSGGLEAIPSPS